MEWINLRKGGQYILKPEGIKSKELRIGLSEIEVVLIREPSLPPDPGDFAYKVQIIGDYPKGLASEIWVPGEWLYPYRKLETNRTTCTCPHLVMLNSGCKCRAIEPYRIPR